MSDHYFGRLSGGYNLGFRGRNTPKIYVRPLYGSCQNRYVSLKVSVRLRNCINIKARYSNRVAHLCTVYAVRWWSGSFRDGIGCGLGCGSVLLVAPRNKSWVPRDKFGMPTQSELVEDKVLAYLPRFRDYALTWFHIFPSRWSWIGNPGMDFFHPWRWASIWRSSGSCFLSINSYKTESQDKISG